MHSFSAFRNPHSETARPVSKGSMRRAAASLLLLAVAACSAKTAPAVAPDVRAPERLSAADALVRAGCFDCLLAAHREYIILRAFPRVAEAATAGAIRTAALLAARERELGTEDSGYLQRARELVASTDATNQQALVKIGRASCR